jgi:hypothetical protein
VSQDACNGAWHGACYKQSERDNFPVFNQETEAEDLVLDDKMEDEDPKRFKEARDGDHLMTPFQCDLCHFENCKHPRRSGLVRNSTSKFGCVMVEGTINGEVKSASRETLAVGE